MEVKKLSKIRRFIRTPKFSSEDCIKKLKDGIISQLYDKQKCERHLVVIVVVFCFIICNMYWMHKMEIEQEKTKGLQVQLQMTREQVEIWQKKYESAEDMIRESQIEQLECQKYNINNLINPAASMLGKIMPRFLLS